MEETITVNGVEYARIYPRDAYPIQIVVLDRGFVYVGNVKLDGDFVTITNAKNIRCWGTTKGLGELVHGPTESTKLDHVGTVQAPLRSLISLIDVEQSKWNNI